MKYIVTKKYEGQCTYNVTLRSAKAINTSITHCECVILALVIQHAMRMRRIVVCGLPRSTTFFHIYLKNGKFSKN
jgi:hypothetical protein